MSICITQVFITVTKFLRPNQFKKRTGRMRVFKGEGCARDHGSKGKKELKRREATGDRYYEGRVKWKTWRYFDWGGR